jgi:arsenate reductase
MKKTRVLFLCGQNTARSQIAEAYLKALGGADFLVESAGLEAGEGINPVAAEVMREAGFDISGNEVTAVMDLFSAGREYDYVVAVCDAAKAGRCPDFPGVHKRLHWPFEDIGALQGSWEEKLEHARAIRDQIHRAVKEMVSAIRAGKEPSQTA